MSRTLLKGCAPKSAPIIIDQNVWEECRLIPTEGQGRKYVDLRTYIRDPESGRTLPTDKRITVGLELWRHFRDAVSLPETWTTFLPLGDRQLSRKLSRGRLIFSEETLQKFPQDQIFLENQDIQGISFIFLKKLARTGQDPQVPAGTIGPLLWSQFLTGLGKMEEALLDLGWLAKEVEETAAGPALPLSGITSPRRWPWRW